MDYPPHREEMSQVLGAISRHEVAKGRPMLSSVVLQKDASGPGKGFYRLGRELGLVLPGEDELGFSVRQLKETFAFWSTDSAPSVDEALAGSIRLIRPASEPEAPTREAEVQAPPEPAVAPAETLPAVEAAQIEPAAVALEVGAGEPPEGVKPLAGNREIEDAAIRWVMQLERAAGREPIDRRYDAAFPADIESPPRTIEVKAIGTSTRGWFLPVEVKQFDAAQRDPHFYVYVVENTRQGDPTLFSLKVLGGKQLHQLLARAKERRYYEVPWPVGHYDKTPGIEALAEGASSRPAAISRSGTTSLSGADDVRVHREPRDGSPGRRGRTGS
jgi:hypothetical protein